MIKQQFFLCCQALYFIHYNNKRHDTLFQWSHLNYYPHKRTANKKHYMVSEVCDLKEE